MTADAAVGCLLGTAVGDAIGLPTEGMSRRRARRWTAGGLRHRFVFGRGMTSDDTDHACMTAQALLACGGDVGRFTRSLAWRLRWWLAGVPVGVGKATAQSIVKLWLGFGPSRSGVWSAGNGPAMRSPVLGVALGDDAGRMREFVRASTRITHRDPKAEYGAFAVATAAFHSSRSFADPRTFLVDLITVLQSEAPEFVDLIGRVVNSVTEGQTTEAFAEQLGLTRGVSGYVYHTVPVVLHAWLCHPTDYRAAVEAVVRCGGDTDTTAAIVGGIVGARVGRAGIPPEWLRGVWEWPRSVAWIERLGERLGRSDPATEPLFWPAVPVRNAAFFGLVLAHIGRRMFPPYG